jgi:integration host factor subunit alpha
MEVKMAKNQNTVTKSSLAQAISEFSGLAVAYSLELVDIYFREIEDGLVRDGEVKIMGLGTFTLRRKRARMGRNPKTGQPAEIAARNVVSFRPSKNLKAGMK